MVDEVDWLDTLKTSHKVQESGDAKGTDTFGWPDGCKEWPDGD